VEKRLGCKRCPASSSERPFLAFWGGEKMTAEYIRIMRIVNLNGNGEEERREFVMLCWKLTAPATLSHFQAVREFTLPFPFS